MLALARPPEVAVAASHVTRPWRSRDSLDGVLNGRP